MDKEQEKKQEEGQSDLSHHDEDLMGKPPPVVVRLAALDITADEPLQPDQEQEEQS